MMKWRYIPVLTLSILIDDLAIAVRIHVTARGRVMAGYHFQDMISRTNVHWRAR